MNDIANIENKILVIRGQHVMLDRDLAELYGVETKVLNQAVKRNIERFPESFSFQLTNDEYDALRFQIGTSKLRGGRKYNPYVFTEQGVAMLATILRTNVASKISVSIIKTAFVFVMLFTISKHLLVILSLIFNILTLLYSYLILLFLDKKVNEI